MGNMVTAKVNIVGVRPLLWHHFGPDALALEKKEKTGVAGNDPEEWRKTVLCTKEGQLYLEPTQVFGCIRDGSKYTKKGRGSIQSQVSATLQVEDDRILIDRFMPDGLNSAPPQDTEEPVYLDVRGCRNPTTRARNIRYRVAASKGWKACFTITWDNTIVSRRELEAVLNDSSKLCGLGDARSIGFGRFEIENIEYLNGTDNAKK